MLKKISWIVALFTALTMAIIGCTNLAVDLDDGSGPIPEASLEFEGEDIDFLKACGSYSSTVVISGNKVTINGTTSAGFYFDFPDEAKVYPEIEVKFKIVSIEAGRPGLLVKSSTQLKNPGNVADSDPSYQLNDEQLEFKEGGEYTTGIWKTNLFDNQMAFQHQAWSPGGNDNAVYTIEITKISFPGKGGGVDTGIPKIYGVPEKTGADKDNDYVFYLNLNDQRDGVAVDGTVPAPADPVKGELAVDGITLKFEKLGQRAFFKLTGPQVALLTEANSLKITVDIDGTTASAFRFGFADPTATSGWNGSDLPTTLNSEVSASFSTSKSADTLGFFFIQLTSATATTIKIESIKIEAVRRALSGTLSIEGSDSAGFWAKYTGLENVEYTWTRGGSTVISTERFVYFPGDYYALYSVTVSAYGYLPLVEEYAAYNKFVNIIFSGTAGANEILASALTPQFDLGDDGATPPVAYTYTTDPSAAATASGNGYTFMYGVGPEEDGKDNAGWENEYATFQVALGSTYDISKFTQITFTIHGKGDGAGWKNTNVLASNSAITGKQNGDTLRIIEQFQTGNTQESNAAGQTVTRDIILTKTASMTSTVYFSIFLNMGGAAASGQGLGYTISDIKLH